MFKRLKSLRGKKDTFKSKAEFIVQRGSRQAVRQTRLAKWRDAASTRRQERADIVSHRKWIFISLAVIAVVALAFYCVIKFGGLL
jgi:hypothetical protein